jgi:hypothetical protein
MKKRSRWILSVVLILAVFLACLLGCDFSCDQEDTVVDSPAACEKYCSKDLGCTRYTYILGLCSCD